GYARISTEDQSHFSIDGQIEEFEEYCFKYNYELLHIFTDEGQSAKDFDRKQWRELEKYLKINHKEVDYLLVMKYDRFSRNVQQALNVINQLEEEYNIKILSIAEPISLPPESPFYFQLRTQMLLQAHVERLIIKDRTLFGMQKAKKDGRYLGKAPYGYKNARDAFKKPVLEIVSHEADIIRKVFNLFLEGYTRAEITRVIKAEGYSQSGKDAVYRILTNKVYIGLIKINAHNGETEKFVPGIHEPIVSEETFYRAQALLARPNIPRQEYNENAYLKSVVVCPDCFKPMTCGKSKGKNKYYWYYECTTHRKSYNVDVAHSKLNEILSEMSFTEQQIEYMKTEVQRKLQIRRKDQKDRLPDFPVRKTAALHKMDNLEEKYILGTIDDTTYAKWKDRLVNELRLLNKQIAEAERKSIQYSDAFYDAFEKMNNLSYLFDDLDVQRKSTLIEKVFGKSLVYDGDVY